MRSLDVDSLLLTSHLKRLLTSALIHFCENTERVEGLSKMEFTELLFLATKESYFIFNGKLYKQVLGVANCPSEFKPHHYRWYVDDILCSF